MTLPRSLCFLAVSALATFGWAAAARADAASATWAITGPTSCASDVKRVNDEMLLACGAVGGCRIAAPSETPDRRATVTCAADGWRVDERSLDGAPLWGMNLAGPVDDRARQAAMWLARSGREPPPVAPAPRPAAVPAAPAALHVASAPHGGAERGLPMPTSTARPIAMGGELLIVPQQQHFGGGQFFGVTGALGWSMGRGFSLGPALALLQGSQTQDEEPSSSRPVTILRPSARFSWGAPHADGIFGASIDLGTWVAWSRGGGGFVPYLQPSLVAQWPRGEARPYIALYGMMGFSDLDDLTRTPSDIFGPFGMGLNMGVSWSGR